MSHHCKTPTITIIPVNEATRISDSVISISNTDSPPGRLLVCNPLDDVHLALLAPIIHHTKRSHGINGNFGLSAHREVEPPLDADYVRLAVVGNDIGELFGFQPIHAPHVLARSSGALPDGSAPWQ